MNTATKAIQFIETVQKQGIKKEAAKEIVSFIESQQGDLATRQDLSALRQATKQDLEPINQRLESLKWIMGGVIAVMIGGFTALLSLMIYLHSNTKAEMNRRFTEQKAEMKEIKELLQKK